MKIAVIGAGGVRTPLIVEAMARRQAGLGLTELALMDIDAERLAAVGALSGPLAAAAGARFALAPSTDARAALSGADFVITTFRVGGIASRVVDERVPLRYGVLGQETTGPGGFAMAMRSIRPLLEYVGLMREVCPRAWLINFANPAGLLAEAAVRAGGWARTIGICDAPQGMARVAAAVLGVPADELYLDYFGLNHLGWVRAVLHDGRDHLPELIALAQRAGGVPGLPFSPELIASLGMIPNEYLFYYYHSREAVENLLRAGQTRGEQIAAWNAELFAELSRLRMAGDFDGMQRAHRAYLDRRGGSYMVSETGHEQEGLDPAMLDALLGGGYAGVALDLIEGLSGGGCRHMILNVPNGGAIAGMDDGDVVEVPAYVAPGLVRPLAAGRIPSASLGLMRQVKAYERLTIRAAVEGSRAAALQALATHPLVRDHRTAGAILAGYQEGHGDLFPPLG